ncbi:hypothetical protein AXG93_412s1220 [Marchantia polymorpha subsp. ruderalis]|uniref:Uncharacterized protein n=1 Tax=Marchantia polymorpha subsp. ruderalis TaxID=1480154 RepID=A0A176VPB1_MARPO|nr:hypothetical protein AXG93_412s1220 [Marchantia polymorpha subsp. ruderalis]
MEFASTWGALFILTSGTDLIRKTIQVCVSVAKNEVYSTLDIEEVARSPEELTRLDGEYFVSSVTMQGALDTRGSKTEHAGDPESREGQTFNVVKHIEAIPRATTIEVMKTKRLVRTTSCSAPPLLLSCDITRSEVEIEA